jgi:hypothetical protein
VLVEELLNTTLGTVYSLRFVDAGINTFKEVYFSYFTSLSGMLCSVLEISLVKEWFTFFCRAGTFWEPHVFITTEGVVKA